MHQAEVAIAKDKYVIENTSEIKHIDLSKEIGVMAVSFYTPTRFADSRGWFSESWKLSASENVLFSTQYIQENHSYSAHVGTLRGLHFQTAPYQQAKLVRCIRGRVFDVAVDLRPESPSFKRWVSVELSSHLGNQIFIPAGFAHGFLTLEPDTEVIYKVDQYYNPKSERGIAWNDPAIAINWPLDIAEPILSEKDSILPFLLDTKFDFPYDGQPLQTKQI